MTLVVVLVVNPSPKFQNLLVIVPVELSVNVTTSGVAPLVGLASKSATGVIAPEPVTVLMLPLPLPVVNTTALLKLLPFPGAKRTTTLVEPPPGSAKRPPEVIEKGPPTMEAAPLVIGALPRF